MRQDTSTRTRSVVEVLEVLAEEADDLTKIAARFDQIIPDILALLPEGDRAVMRELQGVDTLHQYLADTAQALSTLASLVDPQAQVNVEALSEPARLEYFRRRLRGEPNKPEHKANAAHLF